MPVINFSKMEISGSYHSRTYYDDYGNYISNVQIDKEDLDELIIKNLPQYFSGKVKITVEAIVE